MKLLWLCFLQLVDAARFIFTMNKKKIVIRMHSRQIFMQQMFFEIERGK